MKNIKPVRLLIFLFAILALAKSQPFFYVPLSVLSFVVFILFMLLLGYWIYADEKDKGNLKRRFGLYEWIYKLGKNQK